MITKYPKAGCQPRLDLSLVYEYMEDQLINLPTQAVYGTWGLNNAVILVWFGFSSGCSFTHPSALIAMAQPLGNTQAVIEVSDDWNSMKKRVDG